VEGPARFSRLVRYGGVLVGLVALVGTPPVAAGAPSAAKCAGAKAKAFGAAVQGQAKCQAKARQKGRVVDAGCLQKADKKLRKRFAKAGTCPGGPAETLAGATACVAAIDESTTGAAGCVARKLKAAGALARGLSGCAR
jgi:hypothetical protein